MLSTTVSKLVASTFVILASASGIAGVGKSKPADSTPSKITIALDSTSLLVATLANGEIQTHWMPRDVCEHVAAAVAAGESVAGVRPDGVRMTISKANCSTRRVEVDTASVAMASAHDRN